MNITLELAQQAVVAGVKKATELGLKMNVAVVDISAHLVAFAHMDNSFLASVDLSIRKARTARLFDMPTEMLNKNSRLGADEPNAVYLIELSNGGLITIPGGFPIVNSQGEVIGAIGVSGGFVPQDVEVAMAGKEAVDGKI